MVTTVTEPATTTSEGNGGQLPAKGAETTTVAAEASKAGETQTTAKTFTEAEVQSQLKVERERYSGLDKKLTDTLKELSELKGRDENSKWQAFVKDVEAKGGDAGLARGLLTMREELAREREALSARANEIEPFMRLRAANVLISELKLGNDGGKVEAELVKATTPEAMRAKALEIRVEQLTAAGKSTTTTDSNKGDGTQLNSNLPSHVRLGRAWDAAMPSK